MRIVRVAALLAACTLAVGAVVAPSAVLADESVAERCFGHHRFGVVPVDVAKSADGRSVLARVSWKWDDRIGCYLVLDDEALAALHAAASPLTPGPEGRYRAIDAGWAHSCAVRADQSIVCWGANWNGATDAPDGRYTAVAASRGHSCAVRADQAVVCWGDNAYGQSEAPKGRFTAVAAGLSHSCALRADQSVVCWGGHDDGEQGARAG